MATHKSSKKRARSSERKRILNRQNISAFKSAIKKFREATEEMMGNVSAEVDKTTLLRLFSDAQARLAKASAKGILHQNAAARRISRLAKAFKKASEGTKAGTAADMPKKAKTAKKTTVKKSMAKAKKTAK